MHTIILLAVVVAFSCGEADGPPERSSPPSGSAAPGRIAQSPATSVLGQWVSPDCTLVEFRPDGRVLIERFRHNQVIGTFTFDAARSEIGLTLSTGFGKLEALWGVSDVSPGSLRVKAREDQILGRAGDHQFERVRDGVPKAHIEGQQLFAAEGVPYKVTGKATITNAGSGTLLVAISDGAGMHGRRCLFENKSAEVPIELEGPASPPGEGQRRVVMFTSKSPTSQLEEARAEVLVTVRPADAVELRIGEPATPISGSAWRWYSFTLPQDEGPGGPASTYAIVTDRDGSWECFQPNRREAGGLNIIDTNSSGDTRMDWIDNRNRGNYALRVPAGNRWSVAKPPSLLVLIRGYAVAMRSESFGASQSVEYKAGDPINLGAGLSADREGGCQYNGLFNRAPTGHTARCLTFVAFDARKGSVYDLWASRDDRSEASFWLLDGQFHTDLLSKLRSGPVDLFGDSMGPRDLYGHTISQSCMYVVRGHSRWECTADGPYWVMFHHGEKQGDVYRLWLNEFPAFHRRQYSIQPASTPCSAPSSTSASELADALRGSDVQRQRRASDELDSLFQTARDGIRGADPSFLAPTFGSDAKGAAGKAAFETIKAVGCLAIDSLLARVKLSQSNDGFCLKCVFRQMGDQAVSVLGERLAGSTGGDRVALLTAIGHVGSRGTIPLLRSVLGDGDLSVRVAAIAALGWVYQDGVLVVPVLIEQTRETESRAPALWALGNLCGRDQEARKVAAQSCKELMGLCRDRDAKAQVAAINLLDYVPCATDQLLPTMIELTRSEDVGVRARAVQKMFGARDAKNAVPRLIELLSDHAFPVRRSAANVLGFIGPDASSAAEALRVACSDQDAEVRKQAAEALKRVAPSGTGEHPSQGGSADAARDALERRDWPEAVAGYRAVVKANDKDAQAWFRLGYALHASGQLDEALVAHLRAAEFAETRQFALYNAACAWALKKDKDKAFDYLDRAAQAGYGDVGQLQVDSDLIALRDDVRWAGLVAKIKGVPRKRTVAPAAATITFINSSACRIRLVWVNETGAEQDYTVLEPGNRYDQPTFAGHRWRLRDCATNKLLTELAASQGASTVTWPAVNR